MTKHTPENLAAICDRLVAHPYLKPAARSIGINPSTLFGWLEKSRSDPAALSFVWSDAKAPFHEHVAAAMRMSVLMIESRAREMALNGFDEVVTFQGQVQYELDERYVGLDDDTMRTLGLDQPSVGYHRYKRDADGRAIPLKVKRKPSDALITMVLRAHFRKLYGEHKSVSVGGGVLVVGAPKATAAPKAIEHKPGEYIDMAPIEAGDEEVAKRGGLLVVGPPAKTSAELDQLARRCKSNKCVVEFIDEDGDIEPDSLVSAAPTADRDEDTATAREEAICEDQAKQSDGPESAARVGLGTAVRNDTPRPKSSRATGPSPRPYQSGRDHIGAGKVLPGGMKVC
jgi:hypothetical protein